MINDYIKDGQEFYVFDIVQNIYTGKCRLCILDDKTASFEFENGSNLYVSLDYIELSYSHHPVFVNDEYAIVADKEDATTYYKQMLDDKFNSYCEELNKLYNEF